jgi:branched-subunit amino acid transport protein
MRNYLYLIFGMMAVTYLPRVIPLIIMTEKPLSPTIDRFLRYIPYTALSALIVRGIMNSAPEMKMATLIGLAAALISSWLKGGIVLSVGVAILAAFIVLKI